MERKEKNNSLSKNTLIFVVFVLIFSIISFIIVLNLDSLAILQENEVPITVKISNYTAYNLSKNQSDLNLGVVKKGTMGERNLNISSGYPFKTIFEFNVTGDIAPFVYYDSVIVFEPFEKKAIPFKTKIIQNESFGVYSGIIHVKIKKYIEE